MSKAQATQEKKETASSNVAASEDTITEENSFSSSVILVLPVAHGERPILAQITLKYLCLYQKG